MLNLALHRGPCLVVYLLINPINISSSRFSVSFSTSFSLLSESLLSSSWERIIWWISCCWRSSLTSIFKLLISVWRSWIVVGLICFWKLFESMYMYWVVSYKYCYECITWYTSIIDVCDELWVLNYAITQP